MDIHDLRRWRWAQELDERQLQEIQFSRIYAHAFKHGTDGHHAKIIISTLVDKLCEMEEMMRKGETT